VPAQQAGDRASQALRLRKQWLRATRVADLCRLARPSTKGEAEPTPCSSHVQVSGLAENRARRRRRRRPSRDDRAGRSFAGRRRGSEQPLRDGGRGCAPPLGPSLGWPQQAAHTPPRTPMPTPARPRAARSAQQWLSAQDDSPFEYIVASTSRLKLAERPGGSLKASQISPSQAQSIANHGH
jgi:hypothetical protein